MPTTASERRIEPPCRLPMARSPAGPPPGQSPAARSWPPGRRVPAPGPRQPARCRPRPLPRRARLPRPAGPSSRHRPPGAYRIAQCSGGSSSFAFARGASTSCRYIA
ncbi:MAG: hypothetical protein AMS19_10460 [Gemmatimonas sp. SG8_23]|nr:MAG: hypothetical protein AMS19_10460 [Gemmatimonas sp. SG8_23]